MKDIRQEKSKKMIENHINKKLMEEIRQKIYNNLKVMIDNKTERNMILLIPILIWRQMQLKTELSTSKPVEGKIIETPDEKLIQKNKWLLIT